MSDGLTDARIFDQMPMPAGRPRCKHGVGAGGHCRDCWEENKAIKEKIKPLVDEFWEYRGNHDLESLMVRAYQMGMKHESL